MQIHEIKADGYERVVHFTDDDFSAYVAIHNTRLGHALGGCRLQKYVDDADALADALRLSKGMSYKNSLAGLHFGGGKCVVNVDHATPDIMRKIGQAVEHLKGDYITAEDVGTTVADMRLAAQETSHIASLGDAGDPSPWTALGVYSAIYNILEHTELWTNPNTSIWVEGLGKVGWRVAELLDDIESGKLFVSDIVEQKSAAAQKDFSAGGLPDFAVDLYVPCALGGTVHANMKHRPVIICGAANNQLQDDAFADELYDEGIIYCPDFLVNAGGVVAVAAEITGFDYDKVEQDVCDIGLRLLNVLKISEKMKVSPLVVAKRLAEDRW